MKKDLYLYFTISFLYTLSISLVYSQDIDIENIGNKTKEVLKRNPFKLSGGISANSVFYDSNTESNRSPFTYFLNGSLNIGIYNWSIPLTYSLTNQGSTLGYQLPYKFNRLSIHPKYKWIQTHIGDANMSFSPYTYSGLNFTGGGIELTPAIPLKVSAFVGQLNKAIEDDGNPQTQPSYRRFGYGLNLKWEKTKLKVGVITFYGKDIVSSLGTVPEQKGILPKENMTLSANTKFLVLKNLELFGEFSRSGITDNVLASTTNSKKDITTLFIKENSSTNFFNAYNAGFNWMLANFSLGLRYERVDPNYHTLGAYYFNNDMENITANASLNLFKSALSISVNVGKQRDNLNNQKSKQTSNWVGNFNMNLKATERLTITGNYSNMTMFTNNQLNQFTKINENPLSIQQPKDTINYKQIAQNAGINIAFVISNSKNIAQNINANYSLNDMVNKEDNIIHKGAISRFHNANINYNIGLQRIKLNIATSVNYTNTYAATQTMDVWGPNLNLSKKLLKDDAMQLSLGTSYNQSKSSNNQTNVTNIRLGCNYCLFKKHNLSATIIQMFRSSTTANSKNLNEITATLGYNYSF